MTLQTHNWAWETAIKKPSAKLVLLMLAYRVNENGYCEVSQKTVAQITGLTDRTVRAMLKWLEEANFISRVQRWQKDGSRLPDGFQLPEIAYTDISQEGDK